jgi:hypothetical protein
MASHWPPKGSPAAHVWREVKLRLRLVLVEPSSARRILKRRTRIFASHVRRWLTLLISSSHAVCDVTCYQLVSSCPSATASDLWKPYSGNHSGIHRICLWAWAKPSAGSGGNSACRGQPGGCGESVFRRPGMAIRCGDRRDARAGRSLRRHPRLHSQTQMSHPARWPP